MNPLILPILLLAPVAFAISVTLTWAVRAVGRRKALLDSAGASGHAKRLRAVPNIGGVAIFWSIVFPLMSGLLLYWFDIAPRLMPGSAVSASVAQHAEGVRQQTPMAVTLLLSLAALHIVGLVDDRRALGAKWKLLAMIGAAGAMVCFQDVRLLTLLDGYAAGPWLSIVLTMLWIVAVTNAMNFIDNMDGLAAGVGLISGSLFLVATLMNGQWFISACLAIVVGALAGFLIFNFPRKGGATIFMGDGGSLVIGFILAVLTVRTTFVPPSTDATGAFLSPGSGGWYGVFAPLCVLAVPLYDLVSVSLIRLSEGRSPFVGDQRHFSHRLREKGLSTRQTLIVICGCAAITGIGGVLLTRAAPWEAALIAVQTLLTLLILGLYEFASNRSRKS